VGPVMLTRLQLRLGRLYALFTLPRGAVAAEIGVWAGGFSRRIVQLRQPAELHLIDPWQFMPQFPQRMYGGTVAASQSDMDRLYDDVRRRFAGSASVKIHRRGSPDAASEFADGYFDWIYLDGDHSREAVLTDLVAWFPKLKPSGMMVCDDYTWVDEQGERSVKIGIEAFLKATSGRTGRAVLGQFFIAKPSQEAD